MIGSGIALLRFCASVLVGFGSIGFLLPDDDDDFGVVLLSPAVGNVVVDLGRFLGANAVVEMVFALHAFLLL